ncbi:MAG TPA: MOSC domain-containing protein [Longimicrobiales bacterium]|nr:MOSC domain-containing protein [Longimicrobiales bacterium]
MNSEPSGRLEAIWIKSFKRGPMKPVSAATLLADRGILDNADQNGRRQVTIITQEDWQRLMYEVGSDADPSVRRANLMVSGVSLEESRGRVLRVGRCRIEIRGETRPCERMDEAVPGLSDAMRARWSGGAFGVILDSGEIRVGDPVQWVQ